MDGHDRRCAHPRHHARAAHRPLHPGAAGAAPHREPAKLSPGGAAGAHRRRRLARQRRHQPLLGAVPADRASPSRSTAATAGCRSCTAGRRWPSTPSSAASIRSASSPNTRPEPARTARRQHSTPSPTRSTTSATIVEIRDLAVYDALLVDTEIATPGRNAAPEAAGALDPMRAEVPA